MQTIIKRTVWVRSSSIDKSKHISSTIDINNIVKGTRKRKDFNYDDTLFNGRVTKPVQMKKARGSHNLLEKRLKNVISYAKKL